MNDTFYIMTHNHKDPTLAFNEKSIDNTALSIIKIVSPSFYDKAVNGTIEEVNNLIDEILNAKFKITFSGNKKCIY